MEPINLDDKNDVILREKLFKDTAQEFLSKIKLNLPQPSEDFIRSKKEIEECNKIASEREDGRKMKERQRKMKVSKYKKKEKLIDMEEFVGNNEFKKIVGDEKIERNKSDKPQNHKNTKSRHEKQIETKKYNDKEKTNNKKTNFSSYGRNSFNKNNKFSKKGFKGKNDNKKKRLGKSRRAEMKNKQK